MPPKEWSEGEKKKEIVLPSSVKKSAPPPKAYAQAAAQAPKTYAPKPAVKASAHPPPSSTDDLKKQIHTLGFQLQLKSAECDRLKHKKFAGYKVEGDCDEDHDAHSSPAHSPKADCDGKHGDSCEPCKAHIQEAISHLEQGHAKKMAALKKQELHFAEKAVDAEKHLEESESEVNTLKAELESLHHAASEGTSHEAAAKAHSDEVAMLKHRLKEAEGHMQTSKADAKEARTAHAESQKEVKKLEKAAEKSAKEAADIKKKLEMEQKHCKEAAHALTESQKQVQVGEHHVSDLENQLLALREQEDSQKHAISELHTQVELLREAEKDAQKQLKDLRHKAKDGESNAEQVNKLNETIHDLNLKVADLQHRVDANASLSESQEETVHLQQQIDELTDEKAGLNRNLMKALHQEKELKKGKTDAEAELKKQTAHVKTLEKQVEEGHKEIEKLKGQLKKHSSDEAELKKKVAKLEKDQAENAHQNKHLEQTAMDAEAKLEEANTRVEQLQKLYDHAKKQASSSQQSVQRDHESLLQTHDNEMIAANEKIEDLERQIAAFESSNDHGAAVSSHLDTIRTLQQTVGQLQSEHATLCKTLKEQCEVTNERDHTIAHLTAQLAERNGKESPAKEAPHHHHLPSTTVTPPAFQYPLVQPEATPAFQSSLIPNQQLPASSYYTHPSGFSTNFVPRSQSPYTALAPQSYSPPKPLQPQTYSQYSVGMAQTFQPSTIQPSTNPYSSYGR